MLKLSKLGHTWILDLDGTLVKHNGYKQDGYDTLLEGVRNFFAKIPSQDKIIILTARKQSNLTGLKRFLADNNLRYDYLLTDMPMGERILVNDNKPSGLQCAYAICQPRNAVFNLDFQIEEQI